MSHFLNASAVVIGVSRYAPVANDLLAARHDAEDMAALLEDPAACGYDPAKVHLLLDGAATLANVRTRLTDLARTAGPDESLLFYFSGHGHRAMVAGEERSFLLTSGFAMGDLQATSLGDTELLALLEALPSRRQVVILDACHAGGVGRLKGQGCEIVPLGIAKSAVDRLADGRGRVLLTSSRPEEASFIPAGWRNSLFTDALMRALSGGARDRGDGTIGVFDAFQFVAEEVAKHGLQHPVFKADGLEGDFSIARHKTTAAPTRKGVAGDLVDLLCELYPTGPSDSQIWARSGGDSSRLVASGHGRAQWFTAVQLLQNGGGGTTLLALLREAARDFPDNAALALHL